MRRALTAIACAAIAATPLPAQNPPAEPGIPVVEVGPATATSTATIGTVFGVRELPGGRILVNDPTRKQVVIFDAGLGTTTVVIDSAAGSARSYPQGVGRMTRWMGDSTLFAGGGQGVVVLDGAGQFARALALPQRSAGNGMSFPIPPPDATDPQGRLYSRGPTFMVGQDGSGIARAADSVQILRADLDSRGVEPVGSIRANGPANRSDPPINGRRVVTTIIQPVPTVDAWTVLSDGTLAIVRGQDYHVDWVFSDGTRGSTAKLPFDWKRLTDADKQKMVDSARVVVDSQMLVRNRRVGAADASGNVIPVTGNFPDPSSVGGGRQGGAGPPPNNDAGYQRMDFVPLKEIPDFYPPVYANGAMPDLDGNLWILPTTSAQSQHGELIYDVVSPKRGLFQRVRMPIGRSLVGFGKGGVLYLQSGDRKSGFHIERVKVEVR